MMNEFFEGIKLFIAAHKTASLVVAGAVGVSAVGAGSYGIINAATGQEAAPEEAVVVEEVEVAKEAPKKEDVYIPEFKNVVITSESLEKDITIYFSDEEDNPIVGVPFTVKLLSKESAGKLQPYVDAITELDNQLAEYAVEGKTIEEVLQERNVDITVTDEEGNVVDTEWGDISTDPLYAIYLDKETAVQSYTVALNEAEGTTYTDDDEDGVITEKDMEPGDYVLCLVNDLDSNVCYEPTSYETEANVKDKVEYKVQKEITKQIKQDVAAEDGQKVEEIPVEAAPTNTVEYVDSKKDENGSSYKETTDVATPKNKASATENGGKATKKEGGVTSVSHEVAAKVKEYTITIRHIYYMEDGTTINSSKAEEKTTEKKAAGAAYSYTAKTLDGFECITNTTVSGTVADKDIEVVFKYKKVKTAAEKEAEKKAAEEKAAAEKKAAEEKAAAEKKAAEEKAAAEKKAAEEEAKKKAEEEAKKKAEEEAKKKAEEEAKKKAEEEAKKKAEEEAAKKAAEEAEKEKQNSTEEQKTEEKSDEEVINDNTEGQTDQTSKRGIKANGTVAVAFNTKGTALAAKLYKIATNTTKETATLDMTYSGGTFTISASANVGSVKVNGAEVSISDGKGTYKVTADGDYKLTGVATFSDGYQDSSLNVTYTVSGYAAASTEKLKDSKGNQLYLDSEGKKEATAADYEKGKTYYYKDATYTYYGWQSIDGNTYYYDKNGNKVTGTQTIQGVQYDFGTDGVLVNKGTGIDVSKYQGKIDWSQAKSSISFAIVRCGYRGMYDGQLHEDPYFYKNMSGAKSAGINVGVYIYSTALNEAEAVQEASMAVAMAQKAGGCSYPIYLDMEDTVRGQSRLSVDQRMAIVNAFVSTVQSSGYKAGLYCSKNWMTARMNASAVPSSCSIWIAQYNTSCTYSGRKNMWQYSSKGSVPGIKGNVDMNKSF